MHGQLRLAVLGFYDAFPVYRVVKLITTLKALNFIWLLYSGLDSSYPLSWAIQDHMLTSARSKGGSELEPSASTASKRAGQESGNKSGDYHWQRRQGRTVSAKRTEKVMYAKLLIATKMKEYDPR